MKVHWFAVETNFRLAFLSEALVQLKISGQDHGLQKKKKKVYINLSKRLNSIMDDYDPNNKKKTLEAIADIVKLPGTIDAEDE